MALSLAIAAFVVSFATCVNIVWASGNFDPNIYTGLEDLPEWEADDDATLLSNSPTLDRKRKRGETSSTEQCQKSTPKYSLLSKAINPKIDNTMNEMLAGWERQLITRGSNYRWKHFETLDGKYAKDLCIESWKIIVQDIPEIVVHNNMMADCSPELLPGPSKYFENHKSRTGYFQYVNELKNQEFFCDLIRCYCAYQKQAEIKKTYITDTRTKRYFYLLRHTDAIYFVLTNHGSGVRRMVKIVNVLELNVPMP